MAVKVTGLITPNSGSYVAEARHIAVSDGQGAVTLQAKLEELANAVVGAAGSADSIIYEGSTTLKQKITALEENLGTSAERISYTYTLNNEEVTTSVKAVLDTLRAALDGVGDISNNVTAAREYAQSAQNSANIAGTYQRTITSTINDKMSEITEINNTAQGLVQQVRTKIDSLSSIASQLASVFEVDGGIVILSNSEYRALQEKAPNTLYFCYDDDETSTTSYTLTLTSGDSTKGVVIGAGPYPVGTQVTAVALPKSGYEFEYWSDGNTDNPRVITLNSNLSYIAYFKTASSQ